MNIHFLRFGLQTLGFFFLVLVGTFNRAIAFSGLCSEVGAISVSSETSTAKLPLQKSREDQRNASLPSASSAKELEALFKSIGVAVDNLNYKAMSDGFRKAEKLLATFDNPKEAAAIIYNGMIGRMFALKPHLQSTRRVRMSVYFRKTVEMTVPEVLILKIEFLTAVLKQNPQILETLGPVKHLWFRLWVDELNQDTWSGLSPEDVQIAKQGLSYYMWSMTDFQFAPSQPLPMDHLVVFLTEKLAFHHDFALMAHLFSISQSRDSGLHTSVKDGLRLALSNSLATSQLLVSSLLQSQFGRVLMDALFSSPQDQATLVKELASSGSYRNLAEGIQQNLFALALDTRITTDMGEVTLLYAAKGALASAHMEAERVKQTLSDLNNLVGILQARSASFPVPEGAILKKLTGLKAMTMLANLQSGTESQDSPVAGIMKANLGEAELRHLLALGLVPSHIVGDIYTFRGSLKAALLATGLPEVVSIQIE